MAVHEQTVETQQIVKEVCRRTGASRGSVVAVLAELSAVVCEHLRRGDRVRIDDFGLLKLEIEGDKVDSAEEFEADKHIRGVRLYSAACDGQIAQGRRFLQRNRFEKNRG